MTENKSHGIFPAVTYKSINYVFETSTSFKVMTDLLALPAPYLTETNDQYTHNGHLPDDIFRTPWIRGNVVSTSKLFQNYSVLDYLRNKNRQAINNPERYNGCMNHLQEENEFIPSSNPDSVNEMNISEAQGILAESTDPCQEMFSKMQINQINLQNEKQDLYIPEEIMEVAHLKQFKRHLPSLKIKLSRLRMLPVDPLPSLIHLNNISEDMIHGRCEPYEIPPQSFTTDNLSSTINLEEFSKVQLNDEKLVLPNIVDAFEREDCSGLSKISDLLMIKPEEMNEQLLVNEIIERANQNISQVEIYEQQPTETSMEGIADAQPIEQMKTSADVEVDLTLSPVRKDCANICLSISTLSKEPLSPQGKISVGSLRDQRELEMALWTAEKHPTFVLSFMLTEPQMYESPIDFHPLPQALEVLNSEKHTCSGESTLETGVLLTRLCSSCDFTESIQSNILPSKTDVEDFKKISPEQDFSIPSIPTPRSLPSDLKRPEEPALDPVSEKSKLQKNEPLIYSHLQTENGNSGPDKTPNQNDICLKTKEQSQSQPIKQTVPLRRDSPKSVLEDPPCKDPDPLSTFIILRSQQAPAVTVNQQPNADVTKQVFHIEPQTSDQCQRIEKLYLNAAVSGNASRDQSKTVSKYMSPFTVHTNEQLTQLQRQDSVVVQVQATESQCLAYCEALSFVLPYMSFAHKLGLDQKVWGDFICLTMDQTHFLVKQQKTLSRNHSHNVDVRDQEQLSHQVTLIHVLVTFKELLLKCSLSSGVEFLKKKNMGEEKRFKQLLKRLQIILFLSQKKQESNPKLLDLKRLLATWFNNRKDNNMVDKILVLITNLDNTRSSVLGCLHQVIGAAAVADLHLEKDKMKLNGASVVSSMCSRECALVCEDHIGPDFPWQCFSRLVEYDHPGPSPWATVCRERGLTHVSFSTIIPGNELSPRQLEDSVPHVLFVTEGFLNYPTLLQTLESMLNITVLERNHSMNLQMLDGTQQYPVITIDESTTIVVQKQEELCQESSCEGLVKSLSLLSLQYSCCWLILHCPDSRGGGFSSEAFNNLVLVYSSLVIFSMKSEDLDVKVLMVSDVLEMARWISQICFHSLMSSERDPAAYLDREWLTVIQSNEEKCLLHFPCINPLVSQLMLRRAASFQWLLTASLSELKEMLPEVPHKVLKLFSDITSLYTHTSDLSKCESPAVTPKSVPMNHSNTSAWIGSGDHQYLNMSPVPDLHFPFGVQDSFCNTATTEEPEPDVRFELTSSFLPHFVCNEKSWTISDLWKEDGEEVKASDLRGRSGATGKMVGRADLRLPQQNSCMTTHQIKYSSPIKTGSEFSYNSELQLFRGLTPPVSEVAHWGPGLRPNFIFQSGEGLTRASATYGSKSFVGQELKRAGDAETLLSTVLTPLKKSRLSYEKVPGRSDGQTRLKLF